MLWRGPLLVYTVLLVLPTLSAYVMHEDTFQRLQQTYEYSKQTLQVWMQFLSSNSHTYWGQWKETIRHEWMEPAIEYICNLEQSTDYGLDSWEAQEETTTTTWKIYTSVSYWAHRLNLCPPPIVPEDEEPVIRYRPVLAPDAATEWKGDLAIVTALSTALTALRLLVIMMATQLQEEEDEEDENEMQDAPQPLLEASNQDPSPSTTSSINTATATTPEGGDPSTTSSSNTTTDHNTGWRRSERFPTRFGALSHRVLRCLRYAGVEVVPRC